MQVLENNGERVGIIALMAQESDGEHHEQGAEPLAATAYDVSADVGDERDAGAKVLFNFPLDALQIAFHQGQERVVLVK